MEEAVTYLLNILDRFSYGGRLTATKLVTVKPFREHVCHFPDNE
jgi:hypothetical protein